MKTAESIFSDLIKENSELRETVAQIQTENKALREVLKSVSEQIEDLARMMNNGKIPPVWKQVYNEIKTLEK